MANVAPAHVAKEFRSMLVKVAQQLTEDEMIRLSYEEGFFIDLPPGSSGLQDVRINFLHKLEAKGVFSPKNPDGFANLLKRLPREDLVVEVNKYKEKHVSVKATKKIHEKLKWKKSKEDKQTPKKKPAEVKPLIRSSKENPRDDLEDIFALAMTHASSLMSVLEELRELMQEPLPREKLATVAPQVKEAIAILSKEEQTVTSICLEMKRVAAEVSGKNPQHTLIDNKGKRLVLSSHLPKDSFLTPSTDSSPVTHETGRKNYCELVSPSTLSQGYNQVPIRNRPLPIPSNQTLDQGCNIYDQIPIKNYPLPTPSDQTLDKAGYKTYDQVPARNCLPPSPSNHGYDGNVPTQEEEGFYDVPTNPSRKSGEQPTYDNVINSGEQPTYDNVVNNGEQPTYDNVVNSGEQPTYNIVGTKEGNCYDEIVDRTELDENNCGIVKDSDIANREAGLCRNLLPDVLKWDNVEQRDDDMMYANTDVSNSPQEREYTALLKQHIPEDGASLYTSIVSSP